MPADKIHINLDRSVLRRCLIYSWLLLQTMASVRTSTMGDLAQLVPENEDELEPFKAVVDSIKLNYPEDWVSWKVIDFSCEELFGNEITPTTDSKFRFGLPSTDLVRAFYPNAKELSERYYRHIRRVILQWPLGRAILYSPHIVVEKIHAPSYREFMNTIKELKTQGKLTNRERTSRLLGSNVSDRVECRSIMSSPPASSSSSKKGGGAKNPIASSSKRQLEERGESPPPKRTPSINQEGGDHLMAAVLQQQMSLFHKLIEMQSEQNKKITELQQASTHKTADPDLNTSFDSVPDSTCEEEVVPDDQRSPVLSDDTCDHHMSESEQAIRNEIADAERRLKLLQSSKADIGPAFNFKPHTTEVETKISRADPILAEQGADCQRLGSNSWKNVRYKDVQKQFQSSPVFSSLKVNNLLAGITPNWTSVAVLEKFDLTLGAITNGLLQQRKIFEEVCEKLPQDLKQKVGQEFMAANSNFRKNSDDLLQYVCGRRSEVIEQRRDTYKVKNKVLHDVIHDIPPSEVHLFKEPDLSQTVKDQGGIHKFFPFKKSNPRTARMQEKTVFKDRNVSFKRTPARYGTKPFKPMYTNDNRRSQTNNGKPDKSFKGQNKWKGPKRA